MSTTETSKTDEECCPPFDPSKYQDGNNNYKLITWKDKPFVVDGARCLFHVPLAFWKAVTRAMKKIEQAGAEVPKEEFMILSDCSSPWWSDVLVSTSKGNVEGAEVKMLSGLYLAKAFEGSYSNMGKWVQEIDELAKEVKRTTLDEKESIADKEVVQVVKQKVQEIYFYYPTCPKCAKKYGKNYVVVFTKISEV